MINRFKFVFLFICLCYFTTAYGTLNLELTQGIDKALPIAIVPFSDGESISNVINYDLQNSGFFHITSDALGLTHANNYTYWKQLKVNYVILGSVQPIKEQYRVSFQLLDVYGRSILLNQQFSVPKKDFRSLAHHISDLIYQKLTGKRGIFSTKIAYVLVQRALDKPTKYSLIVADEDGYNPQSILISNEPIMSPAWSPNGKSIAYVSFENKCAAIYIQNVITAKRKLISRFPGINGAPAWSPDGKKLALVLTKTNYPKIYILNLKTGKLRRLTHGRSLDTEPSWSPDGKSIIFTSDRGGSPQIYEINLKDNGVSRLTYQGNYNARASFTPDGKSIVMLHRDTGMYNIAVQNLITGRIVVLTKNGLDESPSVAPNGEMIVYATNYDNRGMLAEVSIDGKVKLRLPSQKGNVQEPAWSPFLN